MQTLPTMRALTLKNLKQIILENLDNLCDRTLTHSTVHVSPKDLLNAHLEFQKAGKTLPDRPLLNGTIYSKDRHGSTITYHTGWFEKVNHEDLSDYNKANIASEIKHQYHRDSKVGNIYIIHNLFYTKPHIHFNIHQPDGHIFADFLPFEDKLF